MSKPGLQLVHALILLTVAGQSPTASAWHWPHRNAAPVSNPSPAPIPTATPSAAPTDSLCDGLRAGTSEQNLARAGMSLAGVPNAYQGRRLSFGSCSMAAALTQLNGFVQAKHVLLAEEEQPPFYKLGKLTPKRRAMIFKTVGEADEAVEANFVACHGMYAASSDGMARCLIQKLAQSTCVRTSDQQFDGPRYLACPIPQVSTFTGTVDQRRLFLRDYFNHTPLSELTPLTVNWDTRLVLGPPQTWDGDIDVEHISALIGRRRTASGSCEVLIRNSWGTCGYQKQSYPLGTCDDPGHTDDVWVESEAFLRRSADITSLQ